jgi:DNA-binding phage protein
MRQLEMNCPHCQVLQPVIPLKSRLGYCKRCSAWLGTSAGTVTEHGIGDEKLVWQEWVMNSIEELRMTGAGSESLPWERFLVGLAICVETIGGVRKLSRLTSLSSYMLYSYINGKHTPSFKSVLELCYPLGISPLQLITSDVETLKRTVQSRKARRSPLPLRSVTRRLNRELALESIQAVLDGREAPRGVRQIERSLGVGSKTLAYRFPQECALVSAQYRTYRAEKASQRLAQECEEVRQATLTLHAQGIYPSQIRVGALLSDPNRMLIPVVRAAWHTALRELELE